MFAVFSTQLRDASPVVEVVAATMATTVAVKTRRKYNAQIMMPVAVSIHTAILY
jgi:hypothetical protein